MISRVGSSSFWWHLSVVVGLAFVSLSFLAPQAFARGGVGRAVYTDPLCNNPKMTGARKSGCAAILAQLTDSNSCTKPILDRIAVAASRGQFEGMNKFCPNYSQFNGDSTARALIWRNIIAALVQEESSWNPGTTGDGGGSRGLLQFGYGNAKMGPYRCACGPAQRNIEDPAANARCGTHIYLYNVARDMKMGGGPAGYPGSYGAARFFGPYGDGQSKKRARMAAKVTQYCQGLPAPSAPRPATPVQPSLIITDNNGGSAAIREGGSSGLLPPVRPIGPVTPSRPAAPPVRGGTRMVTTPIYSSGFMFSFD